MLSPSCKASRLGTRQPCPRGKGKFFGSILVTLIMLGSTIARSAEPPGEYQGVLDDAQYLIAVPPEWNGGLVMFAHGYQAEGSGSGLASREPLDHYLTNHGYAWASSGYRSKGYRPDLFLLDLLALRAQFIERFRQPRWTIIHGQSMGGHVAIASLELHPEAYQGGLIECGVVDGVGLADWLYAYTAAAEYFSGLPLLETLRPEFDKLTSVEFLRLMGAPGHYTERGLRFDNVVKHLMGGDLPLRLEGMSERFISNLNPRDPGPAKAQKFASYADTRQIHYGIDPGFGVDEATLNRDIRRVEPEHDAEPNPVFAELTGKITVPVMTLHETADFRVPFWLEQDYRKRTDKAGTSHLLVQRAARATGHCGFTSAERQPAFVDLVAWLEENKVPEGDHVLGDVANLGLRWTRTLDSRDPAAPK
jgi:pimeloyl-ACP methyl ester carboxylesterase